MTTRRVGGLAVLVALAAVVVAVFVVTMRDAPTKDDPEAYAQFMVASAIERYERDGKDATVGYYNSVESVDGEWYVFIIKGDGYTISHFNPMFVGRDPQLRVDATGRFYGDEMLSATEEGKWVDYVLVNPKTGKAAQKHTWMVKHDGLFFGSGWYEE